MVDDPLIQDIIMQPGAHMVMTPDGTVVEVGPEFLMVSGRSREELVGHSIADLFPHGKESLRESVERVNSTGRPDKIATTRYELYGAGHRERVKWWKVTNTPVVVGGELRYITSYVTDVTMEVETAGAVKAIRRSNYVLYAAVLIAVGVLAFFLVRGANTTNRLAREADKTAKQTQQLIADGRRQRVSASYAACQDTRRLTAEMRGLIISSTRASKPFEHIYRQLGLPDYAERLKLAHQEADTLPLVNCSALAPSNVPNGAGS